MNKEGQNGFTLVELLFVVILLSLLGVSIIKVITQVQAASQSSETIRTRAEIANRVFSEMRIQFSSRGLASISSSNQSSGIANNYYSGGAKSIDYGSFSSQSGNTSPDQNKVLRIATVGTRYATPRNSELYGEVEARFYLEGGQQDNLSNIILEFWSNKSNSSKKDDVSAQPIIRKVLAKNIRDLRFRFRQQKDWTEDIQSAFGIPPTMIEVTITIADPGEENSFETFKTALPFGPASR